MHSFDEFFLRIGNKDLNKERLSQAYVFASEAMVGITRFSGEPYFAHSLAVAEYLRDFGPSEEMLIAALLHDVMKNPEISLQHIQQFFGNKVTSLVGRLWDLRKIYLRYDSDLQIEKQIENLRNMFMVLAKDLDVVLIRLADRLHNMRTLKYVKKEKQRRIAYETMNIYAPIAARFGIYSFKSAFEDLSFRYLHDNEYRFIQEQLMAYRPERKEHIDFARKSVETLLKKEGINALVTGRKKSIYSIYAKMKRKNRSSLNDIQDLFALRVVVPDPVAEHLESLQNGTECYRVLGAIHFAFVPVRNRFKDYISLPKPNGYRSLHTTVMGLSPFKKNVSTEIQIRNEAMHREAEYGIAAHWQYAVRRSLNKAVNWASDELGKGFCVLNKETRGKHRFDFYRDSIYVLTPDGEALDLPAGATPVDFAYNLKTELGHSLFEVKVNGVLVAHNYELKNGDVVEIISRQLESPNLNWLQFVKSTAAREAITQWFGGKKPSNQLRIGKELFNRELARRSLPLLDQQLSLISFYSRIVGDSLRHREAILESICRGDLKVPDVMDDILLSRSLRGHRGLVDSGDMPETKFKILIDGEQNVSYRLAKCCRINAVSEIVGYVTRGRGISIHTQNCPILKNMNGERLLSAAIINTN